MNTTLFTAALLALPAILSAQSDCDDLQILSVHYAPFTDTALQVTVLNETSQLFGYPQFMLVNTDGDTLAREQLSFFGIAWDAPTVHRMDLGPDMELPATPFTGTLVLNYFTGDGDQQCVFELDEEPLCPQSECSMMQVYVSSIGIPVSATFNWEIINAEDQSVGSGILSTAVQQTVFTEVCLPIGEYTLHIQQDGSEGTGFHTGVTQGEFMVNGLQVNMPAGGSIALPFTYYPGCAALGTGVNEAAPSPPQLLINERSLTIIGHNELPLGQMMIFDSTGRIVKELTSPSNSVTIDLGGSSSGIYIIRSVDGTSWPAQRFLLP